MPFWTKANLQPKTKSRFIVRFGKGGAILKNIKSITKPSIEIETKEYKLINHYFNYPGLAKWQPITIKFVDMRGSMDGTRKGEWGYGSTQRTDTAKFLWALLNGSGYHDPSSNANTAIGKAQSNAMMENLVIQQISPGDLDSPGNADIYIKNKKRGRTDKAKHLEPVVMEQWQLINPIVKSIKWGELDYSSDDLVEYTVDIVYDYAIMGEQVAIRGSISEETTSAAYGSSGNSNITDMNWAAIQAGGIRDGIQSSLNRDAGNLGEGAAPVDIQAGGGVSANTPPGAGGGPPGNISVPLPCDQLAPIEEAICNAVRGANFGE